jgi:LDH2 family malate/lactate/ureidoglycolate dehydrogenase
LARERRENIPEGWGADREGRPTGDSKGAAAALPLGGGKGYGLAVMVEILTGVRLGGGT